MSPRLVEPERTASVFGVDSAQHPASNIHRKAHIVLFMNIAQTLDEMKQTNLSRQGSNNGSVPSELRIVVCFP
jgi:hypothetical protein